MQKQHRTYWRVRQRYRRLGYAGSVLGGFIAVAVIAPLVHSAGASADPQYVPSLLQWLALFFSAVALPPIIARIAWRVHRRRFLEDIYHFSLR